MNLKSIFTGWLNFALDQAGYLNKDLSELGKERLKTCYDCPDDKLDKVAVTCKACGCFMVAKSLDEKQKCDLGHWRK